MRLLLTLFKAYPWRTVTALLAILLAGIADGASITAGLPLLNLATRKSSGDGILQLHASQADSQLEKHVLDALAYLGLDATLGVLLVIVVVGVTVKSLLLLVANKHVGYSSAYITTKLRLDLLRAVLATRWAYFLDQPIGKLANSMATEANRASQAYVFGVTMLAMLIQAIVYASIALTVSWKATVAALAAALIMLSVSHFLVRMARRAGDHQTIVYKSLLARLVDTLQSVKSLKAMAREDLAGSVLSSETAKLNHALQRDVFSKALMDAIQDPMFAIVVAIGIYIAIEHWDMSFTSVMVLVLLLARTLSQLGKIQKMLQKLVTTESAFWSIRRAIKRAEKAREVYGGTARPVLETAIRFDSVSFAYGEKKVLEKVSLSIPTRALTTILGPSGAGKTTLIDLIIGLYQPHDGTVYLDDTPLNDIDLKQWRRQIGYVPQEQLLLHDSIMTNVTFGDSELTESEVEDALKAANAWDFVSALSQGIHTNVGERGAMLSGGQRQRIMIARALVHRPSVLILDEPTSALDPDSEAMVSDTLRKLRNDYTVLAISHQPALAGLADVVYRLQDGNVNAARTDTRQESALNGHT